LFEPPGKAFAKPISYGENYTVPTDKENLSIQDVLKFETARYV